MTKEEGDKGRSLRKKVFSAIFPVRIVGPVPSII
jgi:hypothetical protein